MKIEYRVRWSSPSIIHVLASVSRTSLAGTQELLRFVHMLALEELEKHLAIPWGHRVKASGERHRNRCHLKWWADPV